MKVMSHHYNDLKSTGTLKNALLCLLLFLSIAGFSQAKTQKQLIKVDALSIEVTIDSVEELESVFKEEDLDELFSLMDNQEELRFTLNCKFSKLKDNIEGSMSYSVVGKADDREKFLNNINEMKLIALKFYNFKNKN